MRGACWKWLLKRYAYSNVVDELILKGNLGIFFSFFFFPVVSPFGASSKAVLMRPIVDQNIYYKC
ncbi:hypothetical protein NC651_006099 [Populus alba x Populus x berolinensis]|nr:hypothetical protein NC651_006099 [Populus alba x Populus x berolinensis]